MQDWFIDNIADKCWRFKRWSIITMLGFVLILKYGQPSREWILEDEVTSRL